MTVKNIVIAAAIGLLGLGQAAQAQSTIAKGGVKVLQGQDSDSIPFIFLGSSAERGGDLILANPTISQSEDGGNVAIVNGISTNPYDLFLSADYPAQNRMLKIVNRAPSYMDGDTSSFGIVLDGPIDFLPINDSLRPHAGIYVLQEGDNPDATLNSWRVYAKDSQGDDTVLSSHVAPGEKVKEAAGHSSFDDPSYDLPFSFTHRNSLIGKGQVIDMAKLVRYVESKMTAEKGAEDGKIVYEYDLPASQKQTVEEYRAEQKKHWVDSLEAQARWEKVALGAGSKIPAEAFTMAEEAKPVQREVTVEKKQIDYATERITVVQEKRKVTAVEKTGKNVKVLKPSYRLFGGELYHSKDFEDLEQVVDGEGHFQPPQWVLLRLGKEAQASAPVAAEQPVQAEAVANPVPAASAKRP